MGSKFTSLAQSFIQFLESSFPRPLSQPRPTTSKKAPFYWKTATFVKKLTPCGRAHTPAHRGHAHRHAHTHRVLNYLTNCGHLFGVVSANE